MNDDDPPGIPPTDRDRTLADFRKAHHDGTNALAAGDYVALANAIQRESLALSEHARAIDQFQALVREMIAEHARDASQADVRVGDFIVRATAGAGFIVARCDTRGEAGGATFAEVAGYRLRDDAEAAAIELCGAIGHVWFADERLRWSRVR